MNIERIEDVTGNRRNPVRQQVDSVSVHIDGDSTVADSIRHQWRHEKMMDEIRFDSEMPDSREIHSWSGVIIFVQPRIRLTRSFDEMSHTYQGYLLGIRGMLDGGSRQFVIAIGPAAHARHQFQIGDEVSGIGPDVADPRLETADLYRISKLKLISRGHAPRNEAPWHDVPPPLTVYRERGHRRLSAKTYESQCGSCMWGCRMAVEVIIDQWKPNQKRYRTETFCYGPLSCPVYRAGPKRRSPVGAV